ncbi:MAG: PEGA domain-containing protein [Deltaproteobacteria bacterium]|nr:MAG: PEGA domain-containing protein [Deltaproteobacteria bacterium]
MRRALRALSILLASGVALLAVDAVQTSRPGGASLAHAQSGDRSIPAGHARLIVITNFDGAEIRINNVSYPYEWIQGSIDGVLVPSDRWYEVVVAASENKRRTFRFRLDERETRILVVDIERMGDAPPRTPARAAPARRVSPEAATTDGDEEEAEEPTIGFLGVSSSPRGIVYVDGTSTGQRTPARRLEAEPGRREVRVLYDGSGELSEPKYVLIRPGVNTNVFFRERRD